MGVRDGDLYREARAVLAAACRRAGLDPTGAELLRLRSNAVFRLPAGAATAAGSAAGIVVRVATAPDALPRVTASLRATRWLAARGFPTVEPVDVPGQPFTQAGRVVSFWRYAPPVAGPPPCPADLGKLLRELHDAPAPPVELPRLTDPLVRLRHAVAHAPADVLTRNERAWLADRAAEAAAAWHALRFPHPPGLVHGDAHTGNLLRTPAGVLLCDWDGVGLGPREWDLAPTFHGVRRFGRPEPEAAAFARVYGWDPRDWPGFETVLHVRELYTLGTYIRTAPGSRFARRELAVRLDSLLRGDRAARWHVNSG